VGDVNVRIRLGWRLIEKRIASAKAKPKIRNYSENTCKYSGLWLALGLSTVPAVAADATRSFGDPGVVRCQICGAQYRVKTTVAKDNGIRLKLVPVANREKTH